MVERLKYDYRMLKDICEEGCVILLEDYKDKYITRDTRIIGKCISCENSFNKSLNKLHKQRNFGCIKCAKNIKFNKIKETMLEKYGVEYAAQLDEFKDKMKDSCLKKYGVNYGFQSDEIKEKIKKTNNEKYGCDYGLQCDSVKEKKRISYLRKYGVDNPLKCNEIKEKSKKTCLEKYGVEYPSQNEEIYEKQNKKSYYLKKYTFPSNNTIKIQGYENFALDELIKNNITEIDILTGCKNVPEIWYKDSLGKKRRHYVDIFIPSLNKCIEIKSTWTLEKQKNIVFLKQRAAKELNYLYEIWVYDKKGNKVEFYD
jgi:hypothetical protein